MLESLALRNFQGYRKFRIKFDPHVTVITGANDKGKSTLVRALRWVCFNKPSGDRIINWGAEQARASLIIDGHKITRKRGKSHNTYQVDDGSLLKAFGADVPELVSQTVQVSSTNFQFQLDAHFWLSLSPGQVAKELNQVANLEAIDEALNSVATRQRAAKTEAAVVSEMLEESQQLVDDLQWAEDADEQLRQIEVMVFSLSTIESQCTELLAILERIEELAEEKSRLSSAVKELSSIVVEMVDDQDHQKLEQILEQIEGNNNRLQTVTKKIKRASSERRKLTAGRCPICTRPLTQEHQHG